MEKVGGQVVLHPPEPDEVDLNASYVCIGAVMAGNDLFSVHASAAEGLYPRVKINGVTMALSAAIPYTWNRPLQLKVIDRKQGPIVFPADGNAPALFWDVAAIKAAYEADQETFFGQLNIQSISVVPAGPTEWPEHIGNPNIGVGAKPGQYVFWLRYYDKDGNRTNPGPPTPHITVPMYQAPIYPGDTQQYPGGQTAGSEPAPEGVTSPYGVALKWQIDNVFNNAGWELVVSKFNDGQGLASPGVTEVVARRDMVPGEFDEVFFTYPRDNNFSEVVPADEVQQQFVNFTAPKAVEVIDNRVIYANIVLKDEVVELTFQDNAGQKTFPFTSRVFTRYGGQDYNDGFADPVNNTYKKSAQHNERISLGLMLWDGNASRSAVVNVDDNILLPERGRRKTGDSLKYSTDPILRTNTECQGSDPVSPTFDAIVQGTAGKVNTEFTNIVAGSNYNPLAPKGPADTNFVRYKQKPVTQRVVALGNVQQDTGFVFGQQTHSLGLGMYGPSNLEQQAPWCEVMSVMRTAPAGRVIASGMGVYQQPFNDALPILKSANTLRCYFPDIDSGVVPAAIRDDITNNPQNYQVKFTPYGFYNETYSYRTNLNPGPLAFTTDALDIITYMDVQNDTGNGTSTSVNVGEPAGAMAIQPGASAPPSRTNNIGWQAWRRLTSDIPAASAGNELRFMDTNNPEQGAAQLGITNFSQLQEGRGNIYLLQTDYALYRPGDLASGAQFAETATRRYHGPVWIVDIIRADVRVPSLNVQQYLHTGTHIATNRTIAIFQPDADPVTRVELFHARPYDAIPRVPQVDIRYAYVRTEGQPERRWMHSANFTNGVPLTTIAADIVNNGFWVDADGNEVYGVYGSDFDNNSGPHPVWYLTFESFLGLPVPPTGSRIVVKYDKREPILTNGFDCTIAPCVWAAVDRTNDNLFISQVPMPYGGGTKASQYNIARNPTGGQAFEPPIFNQQRSIRQWVVMGSVVTRTPQWMNKGGDNYERFSFPRTHYIMRPTIPVAGNAVANGLNPQYDVDYPDEWQVFVYGGFRFKGVYNLDYSKQPLITGAGVPLNGQNPRTELPTGHVASFPYNPLSQDSPGLRTFTFDNLFIVDEAMGEVKMIAAIDQGGRQALWGWTQKGYYNIPYNAQMLTDAEGNVIATQSVGTFWPRRENWIARDDHGMPDEFWRMATKANVPMGTQNVDTVAWVDRNSVYMLTGAVASDIAVNKIRSVLLPTLSATPGDGRPGYSAVYNRKNEELWITMLVDSPDGSGSRQRPVMYVFDMARKEWAGEFSYALQQYASDKDGVVGSTGLTIYRLDTGLSIDDNPVDGWIETALAPFPQLQSELVGWRVNPDRPDELRVYDREGNLMLTANELIQEAADPGTGEFWVMQIDGWQQLMNSVDQSYADQFGVEQQPPQSTSFKLRWYFRQLRQQRITFGSVQARQIA